MKKKIKGKGEISMSLYEINQSIISQLSAYDEEQIDDLADRINEWDTNYHTNEKYFMFLNNDKHYYTILHYQDSTHTHFQDLGKAITCLIKEMNYDIASDEITKDHCEIWLKNDKETLCYLLFPYDQGVVTYG